MLATVKDSSGNPMSSPSYSFSKMGINLKDGALDDEDDWDVPSIKKKMNALKEEPILKPNPKRFVLFPIQFHDVGSSMRFPWSKVMVGIDLI